MNGELLKLLCCPETRQPLQVVEAALVEELNQQIAAGTLKNRAGRQVTEKLSGGLLREDGRFLYPVHTIPVLLVDEAVPLAS